MENNKDEKLNGIKADVTSSADKLSEAQIENQIEADEFEDDLWDIEDEEEERDELQEAMDECGQMPDGGCQLAGTEFCDWECPFSNE